MIQLPHRASRLLAFLAILVTANTFLWAAHADTAPSGDEEMVAFSVHAHMENSQELVDHCDHCCHAGAHVLALGITELTSPPLPRSTRPAAHDCSLIQPPAEPPFIPPIA